MVENPISIYVIGRAGKPLKIGLATDPNRRLRALQTGSAGPIGLLHRREIEREIASDVERRAHWILRDGAFHGEWFSSSLQAAKDAVDQAVEERGAGEKAKPTVGRPPLKKGLKVKQASFWVHEDLIDRIKKAAGDQNFSEFMREAAEAELKRREKSASPPRPSPARKTL